MLGRWSARPTWQTLYKLTPTAESIGLINFPHTTKTIFGKNVTSKDLELEYPYLFDTIDFLKRIRNVGLNEQAWWSEGRRNWKSQINIKENKPVYI